MKQLHLDSNTVVRLPVFLDATFSGIQHLSALMKDFDSASRVNLIDQLPTDNVGDIYTDVVIPVNEAINNFYKQTDDPSKYEHFSKIKLTRKETKSWIMTKPYNA